MNPSILIEASIKTAILNNKKVKLRVKMTPENNFLLYHPYSLGFCIKKGENTVLGFLEKDWVTPLPNWDNSLKYWSISEILEITILDERFQPVEDYQALIDELGQFYQEIITCKYV